MVASDNSDGECVCCDVVVLLSTSGLLLLNIVVRML